MDALGLLSQAQAAGLEVWAEGTKLLVRGPRSAEPLAQQLLARKAEVLSVLVLPEEERPLVAWAVWLAEQVPQEQIHIRFYEAPLRPISVRLSELGRYISRILGSMARLQSSEAACMPARKPGWRKELIRELCDTLRALREAVRPFGLSQIKDEPK